MISLRWKQLFMSKVERENEHFESFFSMMSRVFFINLIIIKKYLEDTHDEKKSFVMTPGRKHPQGIL